MVTIKKVTKLRIKRKLREIFPVSIAFAVIISVYAILMSTLYGTDSIDYLTKLLQ